MRNPTSWLSIVIFLGLIITFFRYAPRFAVFTFFSLPFWIAPLEFRRRRRFRRLGFRVVATGRDSYVYEEVVDGDIRSISIYGELRSGRPRIIWIPVAAKWDRVMPSWAVGRRDEIFARVRSELGARRLDVEYVDSQDT